MKSTIIASLLVLAISAAPSSFNWKFSPNTEYTYNFDGLLLSGLPTTSSDASQTSISCRATIQTVDDRYIHLQLSNVEYSASNSKQNEKYPKIESLESLKVLSEQRETLEMPVRASLKNGLVHEIEFSSEDAEWSKNAKRSILNLISLQSSSPVERYSEDEDLLTEDNQFYAVNETTIEGECQVTYTIIREQKKTIVTKSVNFEKCITRPEVAYGFRFTTECKDCEKQRQFLKPQTVYTYTFEDNKLQQSEVHSVYALDVNGQEVMKTETRARLTYEEDRQIKKDIKRVSGPKESLLYSTREEQLIEEYFKKGDQVEVKSFNRIPSDEKIDQIRKVFERVLDFENNTPETAHLMARAVHLFRMFSIKDLKNFQSEVYEKAERKIQLFIENTLALAGTKNTIQHLIHNIEKKTISPIRAAELLKSIQETQYPSTHIADLLIELARSPLAEKHESLRQSAWLAIGSIVRGFAATTQDVPLVREQSRQVKEKYLRILMQEYKNAENTYEKVLALKAIGNAGLDISVNELSEIILESRQPLAVRVEAVSALRLLKDVMPRKIQQVLLPIYKNRQQAPELRSAVLWRLMDTIPSESVLAHIVSQMEKESNQHVAAFTYQVIRQFSKTTNPCYLSFASRCSKVLSFTRYQPQQQLLSTFAQLPIFNTDLLSGIQFDFATIFEKNAYLPKDIYASFESVFGGNWNKYAAQVGFSQQNFEYVIVKSLERLTKMTKNTNVLRARRVQSGIQILNEIVKKMNIRTRAQSSDEKNAHAVLYFRYKDMDYAVLPIDVESIENLVEKYVKDGQVDISSLRSIFNRDQEFELHRTAFFFEVSRRVPTTIGIPLTVSGKVPTVFSVEGKVGFELEQLRARITLDINPSVVSTHVTEMRFWYPLFENGVKALQTVNVNTPLRLETTVELKKKDLEINWKIVVPQEKKSSVSFATRPVSFIRRPSLEKHMYVEAEERTISHPTLQVNVQEIERLHEVLGLRMAVRGNYLTQWTLSQVMMTEQDIEYTMENKNRPVEFNARLNIGSLEKTSTSDVKFEKIFEKEFDLESSQSDKRRDYFHEMVRKIQSSEGFKHLITLRVEAPENFELNTELKTVCDNQVRMCKWEVECRRSPLKDESKEWTLRSELVAARPQMPSSLRQLRDQPHREVQLALNAKWGSNKKSEIKINAQLEQSPEQKKYVRGLEREYNGMPEYELLIKAARLNQINVVSEYKLSQETEKTLTRFFDLIKAYNFWTVSESRIENEENRATLQLTVEPISRQYVNVTIQTPQQQVEMRNVQVPRLPLLSIAQRTIRQQVLENTGATCKVDRDEVTTFDEMIYNTKFTTCYSLVAKDCSEERTFAVLAKKLTKRGDDLMVKVVRQEEEIVVKRSDSEFVVKVDDKKIERSEYETYEIEVRGDNLIVIRLPQGEIRFDGYTIKTSMQSVASQAKLCGLCGNNDGESDNEFYTADNVETDDVDEFHRSYVMKSDECELETSERSTESRRNKEEKRETLRSSRYYKNARSQEDDYEEISESSDEKIVKKTLVKEYSHRVCFSLELVAECRRGYEAEERKTEKMRFTCMPRHSTEARRLLKEVRDQIVDMSDYKVAFVDSIRIPTSCISAY